MSSGTWRSEGYRKRPLGPLEAQRLIDLVGLRIAPAVAGALLVALHGGRVGIGVITLLAMLASAQLIEWSRYPLPLLPGARMALWLTAPLLGVVMAAGIAALAGAPQAPSSLIAPVVGAWIAVALGVWTKIRVAESEHVRVAVAGTEEFARDLSEELAAARVRGYEVMGWMGPKPKGPGPGWLEWLGPISDVRRAVSIDRVDLIVCAPDADVSPGSEGAVCAEVASRCLDLRVRMLGASQFYEELLGHVPIGTIDAAWYRYILHPRFRSTSPPSKRAFDLIVGAILFAVTLPLLGAAALAVKLAGGGPALYRQRRLGEHGEAFDILKLRTMRVDAEADGQARWSEADDERVTGIGRLLRRTHIDELPQLWNVLRGEMTLVGPRPERPVFVEELELEVPHYTRRHLVKPGVAGWAAVRCGYAGSENGAAWKLCHDLFYVKHRSVLLDLLILVETIFVVYRDAHRALRMPGERFILGRQAHG
jgi:exopolysaccharide biosynthesis polyprenyl glycosylphosphotransferase